MKKTCEQTELMSWIKMEQIEFFKEFYDYLSKDFNYWGVKQENGEYVWFCYLNESCQAGYILEYINTKKIDFQFYDVYQRCLDILHINL